MSEFAFELAVCAGLEADRVPRSGLAGRDESAPGAAGESIVARQLGAGVRAPSNRVVDVVVVDPGPEFDERTRLTPRRIPDAAIESDVGPGRARYWKDAFDCHPERARRAVERAVEVGFFERERRAGREYVRQVARYPDWFGRLVGIENKPDLGEPGDLETQLRKDVGLGLFDAVVLATESHVTGAHLNRVPDEVGVWRIHRGGDGGTTADGTDASAGGAADAPADGAVGPSSDCPVDASAAVAANAADDVRIEVIREPEPLDVEGPGVELLAERPGRAEVAVVDAEEKALARRRLAERAYGKGWRTYEFPGCDECEPAEIAGAGGLPYCAWKGRLVDPAAECGVDCAGYDPAERPGVDLDAERAAQSAWDPDPPGAARRQSGLDRFTE